MTRSLTVLFILFAAVFSHGASPSNTDQQLQQERQQKLDDLSAACAQAKKRDRLCDAVITAKQIGNDSVEFIKEYMNLSPPVYNALTLLNFLATGRARFKSSSFLVKNANHVYDLQNDQFTFIFEKNF